MAETRGWVCHVCRQIRPLDERFCNGDVSVSHAPTCHCGQLMNEATSGAYRGLLHCEGWCDQFHDDCPQCKPPVGVAYNTEARTIAERGTASAGLRSGEEAPRLNTYDPHCARCRGLGYACVGEHVIRPIPHPHPDAASSEGE